MRFWNKNFYNLAESKYKSGTQKYIHGITKDVYF